AWLPPSRQLPRRQPSPTEASCPPPPPHGAPPAGGTPFVCGLAPCPSGRFPSPLPGRFSPGDTNRRRRKKVGPFSVGRICRRPGGRVWLGCCGCFHSNNRGSGWATLALGCRLALGAATSTLQTTRPTVARPWACSFLAVLSPLAPGGRGS